MKRNLPLKLSIIVVAVGILWFGFESREFGPLRVNSAYEAATAEYIRAMRSGDFNTALRKANVRLEIAKKNFSQDAIQIADCEHAIGTVLKNTERFHEALQWVQRSVDREQRARGVVSANLPDKILSLAEINQNMGNFSACRSYANKALTILATMPRRVCRPRPATIRPPVRR